MRDNHLESQKRLEQMLKAISDIEKYVKGENAERFCKNRMLQDAVMMQFTVIGEALIHIESDKLNRYNYPWYKVRSFRNMIAHEYFNIRMPAVWKIVEKDLPTLKLVLHEILENEFKKKSRH
ncbi:MAG: HepT-like ribonuclease domain-containing protein [Bacteroidota bacterium]